MVCFSKATCKRYRCYNDGGNVPLPLRSCSCNQERAREELQAARRDGVFVHELTARLTGGQDARHTQSTVDRNLFLNAALSQHISTPPVEEEVGTGGDEGSPAEMHGGTYLTPVGECRRQSKSAWLHFPHIERLFLLFAFEGVIASETSAIRQSFDTGEPSWVCFVAIAALVRTLTGNCNIE